jgi:hypothetical protein
LADCAAACPFCTAVGPSLSQQREASAVVALAELSAIDSGNAALDVRQVLKADERFNNGASLRLPVKELSIDAASKPGSLWLLFGRGDADRVVAWSAVPVNETSYGYFVREPSLRTPVAKRLRYFARYLEHADRTVAEDAYLEFAHARYDDVAVIAEVFDMGALRRWLADAAVPDERKGLYGLLLGLASDPGQRQANREFLQGEIAGAAAAPLGTDFRAGFDGLLGGYLLLARDEGLERITTTLLANPQAAEGNVRHAMTALRFAYEYGRDIPRAKLGRAMSQLLSRPNLASLAIVDLSRWQYWDALDEVASLYARDNYLQPATRRAVVGYLRACPLPTAAMALGKLRRDDPRGVAEAEEYLRRIGGTIPPDSSRPAPSADEAN